MGDEVVKALDNANIHIRSGEFVSIIGPSGSGKSTLMNIIGCLDTADSGEYLLEGMPIRRSMSRRKQMVKEALELVDLYPRRKHTPNQMSGGQQQRVAIARAVASKPSIFLADEPTGNLDSATGNQIMEIFKALHEQGNTIVLITHDEHVAQQADRSIQILDGKVYDGVAEEEKNREETS